MARNNSKVLLAFEDEVITEKDKHSVNFKTNKLGGEPDYPTNIKVDPRVAKCSLCQLQQPLVVQIYAPLENSTCHRTLYLFACINPNCWNRSESWTCIRLQIQETVSEEDKQLTKGNKMTWCSEADEWDEDNNINKNEENGNIINSEQISDDDEESMTFDESVTFALGNLMVSEKNANTEKQGGGAVGRQHSPAASAEIEGGEGEIITIDSPTVPQNDITALLHEATPLPPEICITREEGNLKRSPTLYFRPYFINVWEEADNTTKVLDKHVKELLQEYQNREHFTSSVDENGDNTGRYEAVKENYETSLPFHGDKMFHYFLSRLQRNPGQLLRYSREADGPLLIYPQLEAISKCQYCQNEKIFEFQVLSTIIPKLILNVDSTFSPRLEFGTALIYTCKNNCWSPDSPLRQETVIIQRELY